MKSETHKQGQYIEASYSFSKIIVFVIGGNLPFILHKSTELVTQVGLRFSRVVEGCIGYYRSVCSCMGLYRTLCGCIGL